MGTMDTRANRVLTNEDIAKITDTVHAWRGTNGSTGDYQDVDGFCYGATIEDIEKHNFILAPGRYVGASDEDDEDEEEFGQKMQRLVVQLGQNNEEASRLDQQIARNLGSLGYEF
jgi:type I restriction enzyme M protein